MENLKRIGDPSQPSVTKRFRPEESPPIVDQHIDVHTVMSRMILNRVDFSKIIGKGGQMISSIRETCGAAIKGVDISEDMRLITISGDFRQVVDAFEMITELLHNIHAVRASSGLEPFNVELALDHSKTGRAVGPKGTTVAAIKSKSGATLINIGKEPQELQQGHFMRVIRVEGSLQAVRRAHFHILELFYPPVAIGHAAGGLSSPSLTLSLVQSNLSSFGISNIRNSNTSATPSVSLSALPARGVHHDVVRQLSELEAYINQYGLTLSVFEKLPTKSQFVSSASTRYTVSKPVAPQAAAIDNRKNTVFDIPRELAGSVIGRGGSMLKELQQQFSCKIRLENSDRANPSPLRKVLVWHDDDAVHEAVKERVLEIVATSNSGQADVVSLNVDQTIDSAVFSDGGSDDSERKINVI